jgi:hypothetical protein
LDVTGNISSLSGNVSGNYILGNGYFLTNINAANIVGSYGNSDVANYLASGSLTSNIITTGNVSGGNVLTTGLISATGNISGGNLSGTLVTGTLTTAAQPNITSVGTLTSLSVTGNVTSSGNVSGNYLLGNGAFITGLPAGYSNADVANYLASNAAVTILTTGNITTAANIVAGNISTTGNISAGNFIGTGANTTIAAGSFTYTFDNVGNVTLPGSGNLVGGNTVSANYFIGNGAFLTNINASNIVGSYGNANVTAFLASAPNINITLGNSNSNITTGGTIRTYGNAIANNFTANNALILNGIEFNAVTIEAYTQQTTTTSLSNIASITVADLPADTSALEVTLRGRDLTNTQAGKIIITWGGSNMDFTRYAEVIAGNGCGIPTVAYNGTTLTLQVTPVTANLITWNAKVVTV